MSNPFSRHPQEVGMTYLQHFVFAFSVTFKLMIAAFCCSVHAFLPFLFTTTTSGIVRDLHEKIGDRSNHQNINSKI